jgi:hypothetical protein
LCSPRTTFIGATADLVKIGSGPTLARAGYSVPHNDLPSFVAEGFEANEEPTKNPVMTAHARFDVTWFSRAQQLPLFFHE